MSAIRFDPEAGRLEGTGLPTIPEMIAAMKANGWRGRRRVAWDSLRNCGCVLGIAAKMLNPQFAGNTYDAIDVLLAGVDCPSSEGLHSIAFAFDSGTHYGSDVRRFGTHAYDTINAAGLMTD